MTRDEQWLLDEKYSGAPSNEFERDRDRIIAGEPLAYIIGWQPFLGLKMFLDSHPLIPRVETEWWVEQALAQTNRRFPKTSVGEQHMRILDLCAGSGAVGCAALSKIPSVHVSFGEIDSTHEATILKNIRNNHLDESRVSVRIGDLFTPFLGEHFDLVLANPPYIPSGRTLDASVTSHEPGLALYAEPDGLGIIRRIAGELSVHLAPDGAAWIEIDSEHANAARDLFTVQGFSAEIHTDQYGRPRVLVITYLQ